MLARSERTLHVLLHGAGVVALSFINRPGLVRIEPVVREFLAALREQPRSIVKIKIVPINCCGFQVTARLARGHSRDALPIGSSLGEELAVCVYISDAGKVLRVPRIRSEEMLFDFDGGAG